MIGLRCCRFDEEILAVDHGIGHAPGQRLVVAVKDGGKVGSESDLKEINDSIAKIEVQGARYTEGQQKMVDR